MRKEQEYERRLLKLVLKQTAGAQPRTGPPVRVHVKVGDDRAVVVDFAGVPAAPYFRRARIYGVDGSGLQYEYRHRVTPRDIRRQWGEFDAD